MKKSVLIMLALSAVNASAETWVTNSIPGNAESPTITWTYTINEDQTASITKASPNLTFVTVPEWVGDDANPGVFYPVTVFNVLYGVGNGGFSSGSASVKELVMPSVTSIPNNIFQHNNKLTTVIAPRLRTIGSGTFNGCSALKTVSADQVRTIGDSAFNGCSSLPELCFEKATTLGTSVFAGCSKLGILHLPSLTSINTHQKLFQSCYNLTNLVFACLEVGGSAAYSYGSYVLASNLVDVTVPYCTTAFSSGWATNYRVHVSSPFADPANRGKLKTERMSGADGMSGAWESHEYGVTLYGGETIDGNIKWIFDKSSDGGAILLGAVKVDGEVSDATTWGATTKIPETFDYQDPNDASAPVETLSVTTIGYGAFSDSGVQVVKIPPSVTSIRYGAFSACTNLTEVKIPRAYSKTAGYVDFVESLDENNPGQTIDKTIVGGAGLQIFVW